MTDYELYHHGIKGQKWGVRRYQNPDGSLKDAGKKRYVTSTLRRNEKRYGEANSQRQINKEKYESSSKWADVYKKKGNIQKSQKFQAKAQKHKKLMNTSIKDMKAAESANKKTVDKAIKAGYDVKINSGKGLYYSNKARANFAATYAIAGIVPASGMLAAYGTDKTGKYSTKINTYNVKKNQNLVGPDGNLSRAGKRRYKKIENKDYRNEINWAKQSSRSYYLDKVGLRDQWKYENSDRYNKKLEKHRNREKEINAEYKQFYGEVKKEKARRGIK